MEVHHHTHHPKSWKEYVQEFLMLFFAVFLGFMSEYYLEYRAERHKEHDYLVSLNNDLKSDIAEINQGTKAMEKIKFAGRRLEILLYKPTLTEAEIDTLYLYSLDITSTIIIPNFSRGTLDQLKYAGGFRLIKNQEIVGKISDYEKWKQTIQTQQDAVLFNWRNVHVMQNRILHVTTYRTPEKLNTIIFDKAELNRLSTLTGSVFLTSDKKLFHEYANYIWVQKGYIAYYEVMVKIQAEKAKELIMLIEKEVGH